MSTDNGARLISFLAIIVLAILAGILIYGISDSLAELFNLKTENT